MSGGATGAHYRGPLRAAIFDWAGTVVDYGSRAPVMAVMETFRQFDVPLSEDEARAPMGMAKRDHLRAILDMPRVAQAWRTVHGRPADDASLDALYAAFLAGQKGVLLEHSQVIPGCLAALDHCRRKGMKLGSSTGYTKELMDLVVPAARAQGLEFDAMVCTDDVPQGRPAPWMCLENARRLNVFPMAAIVAVDDTAVGVTAGRNAGMWAIGVARSGNSIGLAEQDFAALDAAEQRTRLAAAHSHLTAAGAHLVIDTVAELPAALEEIERRLARGDGESR
jgi:phosphonoacetaldehyde hydrolase